MRLSNMVWVVVAVCAASLLYSVKYQVQTMDREIASIHGKIAEERAAIHVLNAEWAFLTRPDRVRELAALHLDSEPVTGERMIELADVPFPKDSPVQLANAKSGIASSAAVQGAVPLPRLQTGVIAAGGVGYVR